MDVTVHEGVAFMLLDQLRDGRLDLVIALVDPDSLGDLEGVRLIDEELVLIAALDHPLARRVRIDRLAGQPLAGQWSGRRCVTRSAHSRASERPTPAARAFASTCSPR